MNRESSEYSFSDDQIQIMQNIRLYKEENGNWPTMEDWGEYDTEYSVAQVKHRFPQWSSAVRLAGGEPGKEKLNIKWDEEELKNTLKKLAETKLNYNKDGVEIESKVGEAVPSTHFPYIKEDEEIDIEVPASSTVFRQLDERYVDFVERNGYRKPAYDNTNGNRFQSDNYNEEEVRETISQMIEEDYQHGIRSWGPGEVPSLRVMSKHDKVPSVTRIRELLGSKENLKKELGLNSTAEDLDVDVSSLLKE